MRDEQRLHGTTILAVRRDGRAALAGDGQVTLGSTVVKHGARKIRRLHAGEVLAGFAGSTGDSLALFTRFEAKLEEHRGQLERAAVELAREWRTDRVLRRLEALLVVVDRQSSFLLSGSGDVIEHFVAWEPGVRMAFYAAKMSTPSGVGLYPLIWASAGRIVSKSTIG